MCITVSVFKIKTSVLCVCKSIYKIKTSVLFSTMSYSFISPMLDVYYRYIF